MVDFFEIGVRDAPKGKRKEIYPRFIVSNSCKDILIRGGDFYAVWLEDKQLWSTNIQDAQDLIDRELMLYKKEHQDEFENGCKVLLLRYAENGTIDQWRKYCQKQMADSYPMHTLDEKLIFANTKTKLKDYASKRLPYPLEKGDTSAWDELIGTLYSPEEKKKIEWAIGSIVSGDSTKIQKFIVLYGAAGTGKSTVLNVIQQLFDGYTCVFDAKALGSANNSFALEAFKNNPLVAIQHDGDLSHIEDNTRLNSLVAHELMTVNEKFKSTYANRFKCFLFMGTNRPVRITDAKSGLIRRLIDVSPTGNKVKFAEYTRLMNEIGFELGAIAYKCLGVYNANRECYDNYIPIAMLGASNDFYNFVMDSWSIFKKQDETTLKAAWSMYKTYCDDAKVAYPYSQRAFKEELKNYFDEYIERDTLADGSRVRSKYKGFKSDKFEEKVEDDIPAKPEPRLVLKPQESLFDRLYSECPAQYANEAGTPMYKWSNVKTKLKDLDTSKPHYVKTPPQLIVIDFDITDKDGNKDFAKNLEEACKWPLTYAEVSKSGKAIHLHYIYTGDVNELSRLYAPQIEIKVFNGNSSLRRCLTLCNDISIAEIGSGLPLKEVKKTVDFKQVESERGLRDLIERNLRKEIHASTKSSIDFIFKILDDAYKTDLKYDLRYMQNAVIDFAAGSTHNAKYCLGLVNKMHFCSKDNERIDIHEEDLSESNIYYDIEVLPNFFGLNWKFAEDYTARDFPTWEDYISKLKSDHKTVYRMINPSQSQLEEFIRLYSHRLVDFNGRRYDRQIIYGRVVYGDDEDACYRHSKAIMRNDPAAINNEACGWGRTDVYDFASAANKKSLKKLEIDMDFFHRELDWDWDKPAPKDIWEKIAAYCDNDVLATEAAFNYLHPDWEARCMLANITGMSVNDTTNQLSTRFIFGKNKKPQGEFLYRNLADPVYELDPMVKEFLTELFPEMMAEPFGTAKSLLPYFPGYEFKNGVSTYRGEEVGEGGYVYAEPGAYSNVALLDIASMHPTSDRAECLFGPVFTRRFHQIVQARIYIKHKDWNAINDILDGKLIPYVEKIQSGEIKAKDLSNALKTVINSVYGLTSASFPNAFKDPRNIDNIVAKRGALFMIDLKHAVQERGFTVAHIKTDSIKIPGATPEIIQFVMNFGKRYGYSFEHEATYDRMCLVNNAVYIAKYDIPERCMAKYGYVPGDVQDHPGMWTATGTQFQVPYVFKTLFSHEPIQFKDMCEVYSVTTSLYLDMNERLHNVEEEERLLVKKLKQTDISEQEIQDLEQLIAKGHNYKFVGRVGQFTPMLPGCGAGILVRKTGDKYSAPSGTKGYRFMESEMVKSLDLEDQIDLRFYKKLVDEAMQAIDKYTDFERFVSPEPYI